jgi:tetratricopeptide (TPR) repeat protein
MNGHYLRDLKGRGFAALSAGRLDEASRHIRTALSAAPKDAEAHSLQGLLLHAQGNLEAANASLSKAVKLDPNHIGCRINLADFLAGQARLEKAIAEMRVVVSQAPAEAHAWEKLGDFLGAAQSLPDALDAFQRAWALEPKNLAVATKAALAASCLGRLRDAREMLERVATLTPVNDAFFALYLDVLEAQRDWSALESAGVSWSQMGTTHPRAWDAQAKAAWETGWLHKAIDLYRKAIALSGPDANRLATLARLCLNALEFDQATQALDEAEAIDARNVHMLSAKAGLLTFQGRFQEAEVYCRRALAQDADDVASYRILSQLKRGHFSADERRALSDLSRRQDLRVEHRISAAFTLGDCLDAESDIDGAFAAYELAHGFALERGRAERLIYDPVARRREVDLLVAHFAAAPVPLTGVPGPRPIFIVGMPRSGTTLIESVLGAHSRVFACGERMALRQIMREYLSVAARTPDIAQPLLVDLAESYFRGLPDLRGADHITDKNPWNFDAVGLILKLFPHAQVIHVRRNPIETGLSIFRNELSKFQPFSDRLDHIGHYYGQYARLMTHWQRVAGDRVTTIQYESFVADFDKAAPSLVEACGLAWEEQCRHFQTSQRVIATLSTVQAREPVSDRSGRAQRYARHLGPLAESLTAAGVDLTTGGLVSSEGPALPRTALDDGAATPFPDAS